MQRADELIIRHDDDSVSKFRNVQYDLHRGHVRIVDAGGREHEVRDVAEQHVTKRAA